LKIFIPGFIIRQFNEQEAAVVGSDRQQGTRVKSQEKLPGN
jgi:hypothetical protein